MTHHVLQYNFDLDTQTGQITPRNEENGTAHQVGQHGHLFSDIMVPTSLVIDNEGDPLHTVHIPVSFGAGINGTFETGSGFEIGEGLVFTQSTAQGISWAGGVSNGFTTVLKAKKGTIGD